MRPEQITDNSVKKFSLFALYYFLSGDPHAASQKAGYESIGKKTKAIERYKRYNLPEPRQTGISAVSSMAETLNATLPPVELAEIIVSAARSGESNRIAEMLLELYIEQEKASKAAAYGRLGVEQKFKDVMSDRDFCAVLATACRVNDLELMVFDNPFYWRKVAANYGKDGLEKAKGLINNELAVTEIGLSVTRDQAEAADKGVQGSTGGPVLPLP